MINCLINGIPRKFEEQPGLTMLRVLREIYGLTGTKSGCGTGDCGACRVLVDGKVFPSCNYPAKRMEGKEIITVEGLAPDARRAGKLHPVQQAFIDAGAVQCGFCTPGMIMTTIDLLSTNPKPSETEIREALKDNICRCTGYAKIVDAVLIASSQKKAPLQGQGVGKFSPIAEARGKVTGILKYTSDITEPGILAGKILYAPAAHGLITSIDTSAAEALPGVVAVSSFMDAPDKEYNSHITIPYQDVPKNEKIFNRHFRYKGDRIAAVAAVDERTAAKALKLIKLEYETYPLALTTEEALNSETAIHGSTNLAAGISASSGSESNEGEQFSGTFYTPRVNHAAMEPHAVIADFCDGELLIKTSCQVVFSYQAMVSELFDIPYSKVRIIKPPVGGAFGGKSEMVLEPVAAWLAIKCGQPIKIVMSRKEVFQSTRTRTAAKIHSSMNVNAEGLFLNQNYDVTLDRGAYFGSSYDLGYALMDKVFRLYRSSGIQCSIKMVYTNNQVPGAMRGYGNPQLSFAREVLIDRICRRKNWDPLEFRIKNMVKPGDDNPLKKNSLGACHPIKCLEEGARIFDWKKRRSINREGSRLRGVGVASGVHGAGIHPDCEDYSTASIRLNPDGSVILNISAHENGQGSNVVMKKIVSTVLEIDEDMIALVETDTKVTYWDNGSYASRETWVCGTAVHRAAEKLKSMVLAEAVRSWECSPEELSYEKGRVFFKKQNKSADLSDLTRFAQTTAPYKDLIVTESAASPFDPGAYFADFVEVEVDTESGEVKVLDFLGVHNSGTAVNPVMLEGQAEGGLHMGLGYALSEKLEVDSETGNPLTSSFKNYKVFRAADMPRIQTHFLDIREPGGPFGAKSIGEAATVGIAPAVVNAISHATGLEFSELPVTPEMILKGLQAQRD